MPCRADTARQKSALLSNVSADIEDAVTWRNQMLGNESVSLHPVLRGVLHQKRVLALLKAVEQTLGENADRYAPDHYLRIPLRLRAQ